MNRIWFLICLGSVELLTSFAQTQPAPATTRFHFREPRPTTYRVEEPNPAGGAPLARSNWLKAWPENGSSQTVEFGNRVALQLKPGTDIQEVLKGGSLKVSRMVAENFFVLEAGDTPTALRIRVIRRASKNDSGSDAGRL